MYSEYYSEEKIPLCVLLKFFEKKNISFNAKFLDKELTYEIIETMFYSFFLDVDRTLFKEFVNFHVKYGDNILKQIICEKIINGYEQLSDFGIRYRSFCKKLLELKDEVNNGD